MSQSTIRFGVWANVYGTWASLQHPDDPVDASWERNRDLILEAERLGYDSTLVAQHILNPFGHQYDQLETWTASAALAALTDRIEIIAAIKPMLFHPAVLAKQALQIEEISNGRFAINLVNGWYKPEIEQAGIEFIPHAERYVFGREWITAVRSLLTGEPTTFEGRYFRLRDYQLRPASATRPRPLIYGGGESEEARALLTDVADVFFLNGRPVADAAEFIADLKARPRGGQAPLRYALAAFVIARETDEEAEAELAAAFELQKKDAAAYQQVFGNADPQSVMFKFLGSVPAVGTNGGTAAGLVGSYDTVAARIREFEEIGVELLMLQFQPFEAEMRRFAEHVMPRVRQGAAMPVQA
jgi:alkanesulfonate monooxygenase